MKRTVWTVWSRYGSIESWCFEGAASTRAGAMKIRGGLAIAHMWRKYIIRSAEVEVPKARNN